MTLICRAAHRLGGHHAQPPHRAGDGPARRRRPAGDVPEHRHDSRSRGPGRYPPGAARRAAEFIEAYADQPITAADIAAQAGVTLRALQYAFRRHYGITPTGYLRRIRLERARAELREADPASGLTVASGRSQLGLAQRQPVHRALPPPVRGAAQPHPAGLTRSEGFLRGFSACPAGAVLTMIRQWDCCRIGSCWSAEAPRASARRSAARPPARARPWWCPAAAPSRARSSPPNCERPEPQAHFVRSDVADVASAQASVAATVERSAGSTAWSMRPG